MFKKQAGLYAGKLMSAAIKEFGLGAGSTWPGHVALKVNPQFVKDILPTNLKTILIVGTNGKTTTAKLLAHIVEKNGFKVFQNEEGANLVNGLATSLVKKSSLFGKIHADVAIFEVDENNLPIILEQITPTAIVFLNLFRDQLDRYGEVHTIASKWESALKKLSSTTKLVLNSDDPEIRHLLKSTKGKIFYFSVPSKYYQKKKFANDVDSVHCPECGTKLTFSKISYSHLGKYTCPHCKFSNENIHDKINEETPQILYGSYNAYNIQAAVKTAREIFKIPYENINNSLSDFTAAFGRQEKITYKKRNVYILLSKNPAGFNQSIQATKDIMTKTHKSQPQNGNVEQGQTFHSYTVLLLLNDRIPDGRDVSWIWDIDTEELVNFADTIMVSGDRAFDMGLRLKYSFQDQNSKLKSQNYNAKVKVFEHVKIALDELIKATPEGETAFILPTYSAMLEARKILTGKALL